MKKKATLQEQSTKRFTNAILESISDGVFTVDLTWHIISFNRAAEEITGVLRKQAIGKPCSEVFRSSMCEANCPLQVTLETKKPLIGKSGFIINAHGRRIPISVSTAVLKTTDGLVIGGAETFRDLSELETLRQEARGQVQIGDLLSHSSVMQKVFDVLPAIATSSSSVLILGETGTGKELVARTIHSLSPRNKGPFIAVNCGALPDTLLESELFGYRKGAFTGATQNKPGRFAIAKGGTIFLDEISEVSPALQIRLLRVLQERQYEPLGSNRTETADVRIITASNKDLLSQMKQGVFREDLYYRINVVRVELPPLRNRKEDIPLLVEQFITRFNRLQQKAIKGVAADTFSLLMAYRWPGNIRELENIIERAFILCKDDWIRIEHLPRELYGCVPNEKLTSSIKSSQALLARQSIYNSLERNQYSRLAAAKELGIHKSTLFRMIKKLKISLPKTKKKRM